MATIKVKISDSISTTSSEIAASSTAVKSAYDLASQAAEAASNAQETANSALPKSGGTITGDLIFDATRIKNPQLPLILIFWGEQTLKMVRACG